MMTTFAILAIMSVTAATFVELSTQTVRESVRATYDVQTTHLSESGVQAAVLAVWRPFKVAQHFEDMDDELAGASPTNPLGALMLSVDTVGDYAAGIIGYESPLGDNFSRIITVRSVGFIDQNNDDQLNEGEPRKLIDVQIRFGLDRSPVFDYTYFTNNYGWMYGFNQNNLIINGDIRANGNFDFQGGSPTVNGSIYASQNNKLDPPAPGLVNSAPVKWTNSNYEANVNGNSVASRQWRQAYDPAKHGAVGSAEWIKWKDLVYHSDAQMLYGKTFGAVLGDINGKRAWNRLNGGQDPTYTMLDANPTHEIIMPDLTDLTYYQNLSQNYIDERQTVGGSANPNYGQGAYVEVWNSSTNKYERISNQGLINGSAVLVGTDSKPIRINGPITISEDVVIKGTIEGQGTIYTGRNTHIVGDIKYKNPPKFQGNNFEQVENDGEKADMLGLAARGSVMMGNPNQFQNPYPLKYMTPPFTKGRYDEQGNYVPPFNALETDSTGRKRYQSTIPDSVMNSIAGPVKQIDAIMYTNFVGGGQLGVGGGGLTINGSLISKDEAMVLYSLPMRMNYDHRIKERSVSARPLIDLNLPRSPGNTRFSWQEHGFGMKASDIRIGGLQPMGNGAYNANNNGNNGGGGGNANNNGNNGGGGGNANNNGNGNN